ncbi:hypothetical protein SAMD00019534_060790 [Acytostelium subglobosum LB1]|uniref:hypothetical protein n=1 Tax=Acytostelium subglobosum LB1 TaxID=1410327 RepID=UPI000644DD18|nr:hypothetical protein SAMD00019534_060790 [Acytostelium subglobosum LB1]GAM22904.1 hypothetical protein SAMD00019534_060790 [Acytostelium subglobosum LB1]|eukprot:XP_012754131.1 hypothetical protein SAMD00019534_060790 [Acytostelium subglobosum LB1]
MVNNIDLPSFSLVEAAKYGQLRECVAYVEKVRLQNPSADLSSVINNGDESGNSPLHWACYKGHYDIVKYLLSIGSNPNLPNHDEGQTPLHWACIGGNPYIVKYMYNSGGDLTMQDARGYNSLIHATQYNELKIVRYLLERGVPVNSQDLIGQTALHWAAYQGHIQLVLFLVNKGAEYDTIDTYGRTPLHWACYRGNTEPIKALCDFGCSLHLKDKNGDTPIDLCRQQNHLFLAQSLSIYDYHPFRKARPLTYNICWIIISAGLYNLFGFVLYYFSVIPAIFLFSILIGICKLLIGPLNLPYTPNPILPTWMLCSFTTWVFYYIKYILPSQPDMAFTHTFTMVILTLYYYYVFKLAFSDPGTISSFTASQDSKDFQEAIEHELKVPDVCSSCLINKPIRARHCRTCRRCVARFDHHCGWINNCVGAGNNGSFIILLCLFMTSYSMSFFFNILYLNNTPESPPISAFFSWFMFHFTNNKLLLIYFIYESLIAAWIGRLLYIQVTGVMYNITMFEQMRPLPAPTSSASSSSHQKCGNNTKCSSSNNNASGGASSSSSNSSSKGDSYGANKKNDLPAAPMSSKDSESTPISLKDAILMPSRNCANNPHDRGSIKRNVQEFIYETNKWYRNYSHQTIDF